MNKLLYPKSVTIVGVSNKKQNLGKNIINNLKNFGYSGEINCVGRESGEYRGAKIYPYISELPTSSDLAVIITPYNTVPFFLEECGKKSIKRVVIETGGFSEYDSSRAILEKELNVIAQEYNIRFLGPNCLGIINRKIGLNLCFMEFPTIPKEESGAALLTQSGGVGLMYLNAFLSEKIPWSIFVSLGNMANIQESDLLDFLMGDENSKSVALYIEGIKNPRRFYNITKGFIKPIVIQKVNITPFGESAAKTHTSALLNNDTLVDSLFKQSGIIRANYNNEFINCVKINSLPSMKGNNLAIISRSGGHAVIAADGAYINGFNLPSFSSEFLDKISSFFRARVIKAQNPLDLGDLFDFEIYIKILKEVIVQDNFDGILFILVYDSTSESESSRRLLNEVAQMIKLYNKPVITCLHSTNDEINSIKNDISIPIFGDPIEVLTALGKVNKTCKSKTESINYLNGINNFNLNFAEIRKIIHDSLNEGKHLLTVDAFSILKLTGINYTPHTIYSTNINIEEVKNKINFPVALKILSDEISHKSDVGGVLLNIQNIEELKESINLLKNKLNSSSFLIQEMAQKDGEEVFIGAKNDSQFGSVVTFGLGGILVELYQDSSSRLAPLSDFDIDSMINETKSSKILMGYRGKKKKDILALKECLAKVSFLITNVKEIKELDINPIFVLDEGKGLSAVDVRIVIGCE